MYVYFNTPYLSLWSTPPNHLERCLIAIRTLIHFVRLRRLLAGFPRFISMASARSAHTPHRGEAFNIWLLIYSAMPSCDPLSELVGRHTRAPRTIGIRRQRLVEKKPRFSPQLKWNTMGVL